MKNILILTAVLTCVALTPLQANEKWTVDEKVQRLKSKLNLTDEQATKVRPIIEDYKSKMDEITKEKHDKLRSVLTVDQMDKLEKMADKKDGHDGHKHEHHHDKHDKD